jgi:diaminohydroxyphosphoribosylaminopyrimidine deaminase/5-amino-6-(5-phosphoribosylamino)uracil reductase
MKEVDKQNIKDELYMQRAIALAQLAGGYQQPNPKVGSVIVYQDKIIGEGYHQQYGQAHAEVNAVASVKDKSLLTQSTIYVTLEPCHHYGKTPPCVDLILQHKIPRVVIGSEDPFPQVAGQSIQKLRNAGVEVVIGVLKKEIEWLNRRFFTTVRKNRPYIILKYAVSADGFIGREGEEIKISNAFSQRLVHRWRAEEAAIMVGTNTALTDDPQLGNRLYPGPAPHRIVLDRKGRLPKDLQLFDQSLPTLVLTEEPKADQPNLEYLQLPFQSQDFLPSLLAALQGRKIQSVLIEGGAALLQSFLDAGLWDELRVLEANQKLGEGLAAPVLPKHYLYKQLDLGDTVYKQLLPIA